MRLSHLMLAALMTFATQACFAADAVNAPDLKKVKSKQCEAIASACLSAGYARKGGEGKEFWFDCMKPILGGKEVKGVEVASSDVKMCREFKIKDLQKELGEMKKSS